VDHHQVEIAVDLHRPFLYDPEPSIF
jgi:hypothetical protein